MQNFLIANDVFLDLKVFLAENLFLQVNLKKKENKSKNHILLLN